MKTLKVQGVSTWKQAYQLDETYICYIIFKLMLEKGIFIKYYQRKQGYASSTEPALRPPRNCWDDNKLTL